jgi:hypothetical protein
MERPMASLFDKRDMKIVWKTPDGQERHRTSLTFAEALAERKRLVELGIESKMEPMIPAWLTQGSGRRR